MNALRGFLEHGSTSSDPSLVELCLDSQTWKAVFDIYLRRYEGNKPKPMKQLLVALMHVRAEALDNDTWGDEIDYASAEALKIICGGSYTPAVKPAFQILEYLLQKDLITVERILNTTARIQATQDPSHSILLQNAGEKHFASVQNSNSNDDSLYSMQNFVSDILTWIQHSDVAAAAGRLLSVFVKAAMSSSNRDCKLAEYELPVCMTVLKAFLYRNLDLRGAIKTFVLPNLLRLSHDNTLVLLKSMLLLDSHRDGIGGMSNADTEVSLLAIEVAEDCGYLSCSGTPRIL